MKKIYFFLVLCGLLTPTSSYSQFKFSKLFGSTNKKTESNTNPVTGLTENEIIGGLKEALSQGASNAGKALNKEDGYNLNPKVRIPFPEDAAKVAKALRDLGYGEKVDEFEKRLNRSAEKAAKEAAPIFIGAIKEMSFTDAKNILTGGDTAATQYLRKSTYNPLYSAFSPHVKSALDSTNASTLWTELATLYNKIPFNKNKVQTDLIAYTTHKALKGLFVLVAEEEAKIRKDPVARTTDLLKKVFGSNN